MRIIFTNKIIFLVAMPIIILSIFALTNIQKKLQHDAMEQLKGHMLELVQHYASSISSELDKSSTITNTTALYLAANPISDKNMHYKLLESNLRQNKVIYGAAIAYERSYFQNETLFAPYVYRKDEGLARIDIPKDAYDYTEETYSWFASVKNQMSPNWSEPYFDKGAGNILMITYSTPIINKTKFAGVVTADIDIEKLNKSFNLGSLSGSDYVILTNTGHFAYHTNPKLIGKSFINIADDLGFERSIYIARKMITGEKGYAELADKEGKVEMIFYAPIGNYGWSFALALKKDSAFKIAFDNSDSMFLWILALFTIGLLGSVMVAYFSFIKPMHRLNRSLIEYKEGMDLKFCETDYPSEFKEIVNNMTGLFDQNRKDLESYRVKQHLQEETLTHKAKLLEKADKRIMGLLSSAQNSVVIINSMGEILSTNNKSESILKLKVENMIGESIVSFIAEEDKDTFAQTLNQLFSTTKDTKIDTLTIVSRTNVTHKVQALFKPVFVSDDEIEANIVFIKVDD